MEKLNVLVLCGGKSVESDISIITGVLAYNYINQDKFNKYLIYIDNDNKWWLCEDFYTASDIFSCKKKAVTLLLGDSNLYFLKGKKVKRAFEVHSVVMALHGGLGESGGIAGLLEMSKIPYTSSDLCSSAIAMDKAFTKMIAKSNGIKVVPYILLYKDENISVKELNKIEKSFDYPVIVKPNSLGSSIGIKVARNRDELVDGVEFAFNFSNKVLIEKVVEDFKEYNISATVLGGEIIVSEIESPKRSSEILSFADKYVVKSKTKFHKIKGMGNGINQFANVSAVLKNKIETTTKRVYKLFDCKGIIRCDFILSKDNVLYLNEINSIPGSLSLHLYSDIERDKLIEQEIYSSIKSMLDRSKLISNFDSSLFD